VKNKTLPVTISKDQGDAAMKIDTWAAIRHLYHVEKLPKKAIARKLGLDPKTVRGALKKETFSAPSSPHRTSKLDPFKDKSRPSLKPIRASVGCVSTRRSKPWLFGRNQYPPGLSANDATFFPSFSSHPGPSSGGSPVRLAYAAGSRPRGSTASS